VGQVLVIGEEITAMAERNGALPARSGRVPDVLEIGLRGRRQPRVEAYWDGCLIAL